MNILFVSSEVSPFAKTGGLADVSGSLPRTLKNLGHDIRVVLPCYPDVRNRGFSPTETGVNFTVRMGVRTYFSRLKTLTFAGVQTYFIEQPELFDRPGLYGYSSGDYPDNAERFTFFCRAVLLMLEQIDFHPDLLHLNDWQTGLIPVLLKTEPPADPGLRNLATLFTIHNLGYQGSFPVASLQRLGLSHQILGDNGLAHRGQVSMLKGGIQFSHRVNTVSPTYCREICTTAFGAGLEGLLKRKGDRLSGILNGLDPEEWNPRQDPQLAAAFDADDLRGKRCCKSALQEELGLKREDETLLVALITRLDQQKGLDLLLDIWKKLLEKPLQIVLLGSGDQELQRQISSLPQGQGRIALHFRFDELLARRIYAGSDLFLMPSHYEPCGLGQMIALRYGSVPLVRRTGGLADTIIDRGTEAHKGTGFSFDAATAEALLKTIDRALACFRHRDEWQQLVRRGMQQDFSWERSARSYLELYRLALEAGDV